MSQTAEKITNPFEEEYIQQELDFYGLKEYRADNIDLVTKEVHGRLNDYLMVNIRFGESFPILYIDKQLWMSLTPMELQSQWRAIQLAEGRVGIAGLGMGYALLRIMEKPEVESVTVFEIEASVINFFTANFRHREGFSKVHFSRCDARTVKGHKFDFFYCDIYQTMLDDDTLDDEELLRENNEINRYVFWGEELAFYLAADAMSEDYLDFELPDDMEEYLALFYSGVQNLLNPPLDWRGNLDYLSRLLDVKGCE